MKKLFITFIVLITLSVFGHAQRIPGGLPKQHNLKVKPHKKIERKKDRIKSHRMQIRRHRHHRKIQQLNLSDNQKQQEKLSKENHKNIFTTGQLMKM